MGSQPASYIVIEGAGHVTTGYRCVGTSMHMWPNAHTFKLPKHIHKQYSQLLAKLVISQASDGLLNFIDS